MRPFVVAKEVCFWLTIHTGVALSLALFFIYFSILFRCLIVQYLIVLSSFLYLPSHQVLILTWWCFFNLLLFLFSFYLKVIFLVLSSLPDRFLFASMVFAFWYILSFFCSNSVMKLQSSVFMKVTLQRLLFLLVVEGYGWNKLWRVSHLCCPPEVSQCWIQI